MVVVWHTVPVNSVDDLRTKETTMGASGVQSGQAFVGRLLNATLGTKMRVVPGYKGMGDIFLAMERGEVDGYPGVFYSRARRDRPDWLPKKQAKVIVQFGSHPLKELPGVPFATDLAQQCRGQAADGSRRRAAGVGTTAGDAAGRAGRPRGRDAQGAGRHVRRSGVHRRRGEEPDGGQCAAERARGAGADRARIGDARSAWWSGCSS